MHRGDNFVSENKQELSNFLKSFLISNNLNTGSKFASFKFNVISKNNKSPPTHPDLKVNLLEQKSDLTAKK